jgi:hypothetical protein
LEEHGILASLLIGGIVEALRCIQNGELIPLVAFVGIPLFSLMGCIL